MNDTKLHDSLNVTIDTATKLLEDIRQNRVATLALKSDCLNAFVSG